MNVTIPKETLSEDTFSALRCAVETARARGNPDLADWRDIERLLGAYDDLNQRLTEYARDNSTVCYQCGSAFPPNAPAQRPSARSCDCKVCLEVREIMKVYDEQVATHGHPDTPGGLEHMGDVWRLLARWASAESPKTTAGD